MNLQTRQNMTSEATAIEKDDALAAETPEANATPVPAIDAVAPEESGGKAADAAPSPPLSHEGSEFRGRLKIIMSEPLGRFENPCVQAFNAIDSSNPSQKFAVMVCKHGMPVRHAAIKALNGVMLPGMMSIVDHEPIMWPQTGQMHYAAAMTRPSTESVQSPQGMLPKIPEQDLMRNIAEPIVASLRELHERQLTFRAIRADNLFWIEKGQQRVMLGDGFCQPPGYKQPAVYESLNSAMCDPSARGPGSISDDIFSLGVMLFFLSIGKNPLANVQEEELITRRLEMGTFDYYTSHFSIPAMIMEGLRGMLTDDPDDRWRLEDVEAWVRGSRQAVKSLRSPRRASRPFPFAEKNHLLVSELVYSFSKHWPKAAEVIRNKSLDAWIRRSVGDEPLADLVHATIGASGYNSKSVPDDVLVGRVCSALDPEGPIRFRNFSFHADGVGDALALASAQEDQERIGTIVQAINTRLPVAWYAIQAKAGKMDRVASTKFESLSSFLDNKSAGFGVERCVYELNPEFPCLSKNLRTQYLVNPKNTLPLLEEMAGAADRPRNLIDRHLAAFLGARVTELKDSDFRVLSSPDSGAQALGMVSLLAKMQKIHRIKELKNLTRLSIEILQPALNKYKNIARRRRIVDNVHTAARNGNIAEVLMQAENENERLLDETGYRKAAIEHATITLRLANLAEMKKKEKEISQAKGDRVALSLAGIIATSFLIVLFYASFV